MKVCNVSNEGMHALFSVEWNDDENQVNEVENLFCLATFCSPWLTFAVFVRSWHLIPAYHGHLALMSILKISADYMRLPSRSDQPKLFVLMR